MMRRIEAAAQRRVAELAQALGETAAADLPPGVRAEAGEDGVILSGPGLARALAFDGRLRGWATRIGSGR